MSLLGLPIPAPGLYAKNNVTDGWRHRAASTVRDRDPGQHQQCVTETQGGHSSRPRGQQNGWMDTELLPLMERSSITVQSQKSNGCFPLGRPY